MMKSLIITLATVCSVAVSQTCPPTDFDAKQDFVFEKFVPADWYPIKQLPVIYQPESDFYCVSARYDVADESLACRVFGLACITAIDVLNIGRVNAVNGNSKYINFRATIPNDNEPAKAYVGPDFLPNFLRFGTNYWVVAAGTYAELVSGQTGSDVYQYAIISAGPPNEVSNGKCIAPGGVWLFALDPVPPAGVAEALENMANDMGLDVASLLPVEHTDCDYNIQASNNVFGRTFNTFSQFITIGIRGIANIF